MELNSNGVQMPSASLRSLTFDKLPEDREQNKWTSSFQGSCKCSNISNSQHTVGPQAILSMLASAPVPSLAMLYCALGLKGDSGPPDLSISNLEPQWFPERKTNPSLQRRWTAQPFSKANISSALSWGRASGSRSCLCSAALLELMELQRRECCSETVLPTVSHSSCAHIYPLSAHVYLWAHALAEGPSIPCGIPGLLWSWLRDGFPNQMGC